MGYGDQPTAVFSIAAIVCALGVFTGFGPLLAVVAMVSATLGLARGEGLAGAAVALSIFALFAAFFLPSATLLARV